MVVLWTAAEFSYILVVVILMYILNVNEVTLDYKLETRSILQILIEVYMGIFVSERELHFCYQCSAA